MSDLCDYLLVWIKLQCENTETHKISAEVYDRAVFCIGTFVPLAVFGFVLFCMVIAVLCVYKFVGGRRHE